MYTQFEEKGKIYTQKISKDQREVIIQTTKQKISGNIYVQVDQRLIDDLNSSDNFLAVTDVKIFNENENVIYKSNFLAIDVHQIVWILPVDEVAEK